MAEQSGPGLLAVWTDVDQTVEEEFNAWYQTEHIPQLLSLPGFVSARRDQAVVGKPKYVTLYTLSDTNALKSQQFRDLQDKDRTPWSRRMVPYFRNMESGLYRQIFDYGTLPEKGGAVVYSVQLNIPADKEDEFNEWYNVDHVPALVGVPGVHCARRYVAVKGEPKYLAVYEMEDATILTSAEWNTARNSDWTLRMAPYLQDVKVRAGSRLFPE